MWEFPIQSDRLVVNSHDDDYRWYVGAVFDINVSSHLSCKSFVFGTQSPTPPSHFLRSLNQFVSDGRVWLWRDGSTSAECFTSTSLKADNHIPYENKTIQKVTWSETERLHSQPRCSCSDYLAWAKKHFLLRYVCLYLQWKGRRHPYWV